VGRESRSADRLRNRLPQGGGKKPKAAMSSAASGISRAAPTSPSEHARGYGGDGDRAVDYRMCLLHKSQYEVIDDWQGAGDARDGQHEVVAKDVSSPSTRLGHAGRTRRRQISRAKTNPNPAYCVPLSALGGHGIGACAVGNAQAALEATIASVKEAHRTHYTGRRYADFQAVQLRGRRGGREKSTPRALSCATTASKRRKSPTAADRRRRNEAPLQAQSRYASASHEAVHTAARDGGRDGIYEPIRWSGSSATRTPLQAISASASMRKPRLGARGSRRRDVNRRYETLPLRQGPLGHRAGATWCRREQGAGGDTRSSAGRSLQGIPSSSISGACSPREEARAKAKKKPFQGEAPLAVANPSKIIARRSTTTTIAESVKDRASRTGAPHPEGHRRLGPVLKAIPRSSASGRNQAALARAAQRPRSRARGRDRQRGNKIPRGKSARVVWPTRSAWT